MMHGREKSDSAIVAVKPANNDGQPSAESVERRAGAEGNAGQDRMHRAQDRESVSQGLDRVRQVRRQTPTVGAGCGNPARPDLRGGRSVTSVPTAIACCVFTSARVSTTRRTSAIARSPICRPKASPSRRARSASSSGGLLAMSEFSPREYIFSGLGFIAHYGTILSGLSGACIGYDRPRLL